MRFLVAAIAIALFGCSCGSTQRPSYEGPATPIELSIVNRRAQPIFILSTEDCGFHPVGLQNGDGQRIHLTIGQSFTCDAVTSGEGCPTMGGCPGASVQQIAPGASLPYRWDGRHYESATVDRDQVGVDCPTDCYNHVALAPGSYVFSADAFGTCEGDCSCPPEGTMCDVPAGVPDRTRPDLHAEVRVQVGQATTAEIVFQ